MVARPGPADFKTLAMIFGPTLLVILFVIAIVWIIE